MNHSNKTLQEQLDDAVMHENYKLACILRDAINNPEIINDLTPPLPTVQNKKRQVTKAVRSSSSQKRLTKHQKPVIKEMQEGRQLNWGNCVHYKCEKENSVDWKTISTKTFKSLIKRKLIKKSWGIRYILSKKGKAVKV